MGAVESPQRALCAAWSGHERHVTHLQTVLEDRLPELTPRDRERLMDELNGHLIEQAQIQARLLGG